MPRYALLIEYDGSPFAGWQRQADQPSVQGALETALTVLNGGNTPVVHGAGRTDAGVHATGQIAHVDLDVAFEPRRLPDAVNFHLRPAPVAVRAAAHVADTFEARFSAEARHYRYVIVNRRAHLTLNAGRAWRVPAPLSADAMAEGARRLIGHHDFSTFRDAECQADSPIRTLSDMQVHRAGETITITCWAQSFLHRQVRSMVGSLVEVGRGRRKPSWIAEILAARDRSACGPVAPSDGLYLTRVDYPDGLFAGLVSGEE